MSLFALLLIPLAFSFNVAQITDLHFDPSVFRLEYGSDSSFKHIQSSVANLASSISAWNVSCVLLTGDIARHPNGSKRTLKEILKQNRKVSLLMQKHISVPVIINIGNNDIHPHNYLQGHSKMIKALAEEWKWALGTSFHHFHDNGYYTHVIKGIRYVSLNTILFFNLNFAVKSCKSGSAGYEHLVWLRRVFDGTKEKIVIAGHVPPSVIGWYWDCLELFGEILFQYKDRLLGQFYGHVNFDHAFYLRRNDKYQLESITAMSADFDIQSSIYVDWVERNFKSIVGLEESDVIPVYVSASIVPTRNPGYKIFSINERGVYDWTTFYVDMQSDVREWKLEYTFSICFAANSYFQVAKYVALNTFPDFSELYWKYFYVSAPQQ